MSKKDRMEIRKGACPYCHGDIMLNYKGRPHLAKCIKCSRMLVVKKEANNEDNT